MTTTEKLKKLKNILSEMKSVVVAFSGGVDSAFLLKTATGVLKDNVFAVICRSDSFPEREYNEAVSLAEQIGVKHITLETDEMSDENYISNPPDRCYYCKKIILSNLLRLAKAKKYNFVIEGSNTDDINDYRPGSRALNEMNVRSPLKEAGLTKQEIRSLSRDMGLPTWDKPSAACLSSRLPYGTRITAERLRMVDMAEEYLSELGLTQVRVRYHGDVARIEVPKKDMEFILREDVAGRIAERFKEIGFAYTSLDILGYRMGSLNETLKED